MRFYGYHCLRCTVRYYMRCAYTLIRVLAGSQHPQASRIPIFFVYGILLWILYGTGSIPGPKKYYLIYFKKLLKKFKTFYTQIIYFSAPLKINSPAAESCGSLATEVAVIESSTSVVSLEGLVRLS